MVGGLLESIEARSKKANPCDTVRAMSKLVQLANLDRFVKRRNYGRCSNTRHDRENENLIDRSPSRKNVTTRGG